MNLSLIESTVRQFCNALEDHNYRYTRSAVRKIVETSLARKKGLYDIFSKHPNWDENQLCIHFDQNFERRIEVGAYHEFLRWLYYATAENCDTVKRVDRIEVYKHENGWGDVNLYEAFHMLPPETTLPEFQELKELHNTWERDRQKQYQDALGYLNAQDEKWNFRPGMKLNRVINKICTKYGYDKLPEYNRKFAEFSDAITPMSVKRHTTISINPVDFLMMSHGNSWRSCHWIGDDPDDAGCYSSGTVSYMMGNDSFIVSIIDQNADGDNLAMEEKIMRQVFGYHDYQILQSRLYPQNCDSGAEAIYANIRTMVEEIIANGIGEANRWVKTEQNVFSEGTAYQDWEYNRLCKQWVIRGHEEESLDAIRMSDEPICIKCGWGHMNEENILCEDCKGHYCKDCGCEIDMGDPDSYIEIDGDYWCKDCRFICEKCGELERTRDRVWISDIEEEWCEWCANRHATVCMNCNEYISEAYAHDKDGNAICEDCYDSYYVTCAGCGDIVHEDEVEYIEGEGFCKTCAEEVRKNREEEEESA